VRPETVRAPEELERPLPRRLLKDEPLTMRLVVEAELNEEYRVEEEYVNLWRADQ
jgi:hypothetical protein